MVEADQIIATAAAHHRSLTVHQNRRWDPDFVAVRRAVDAGLLGKLFNVETFVGGYAHPCRTWHSDTAVSGGAGYDWGSHYVDWILQLLGGVPQTVQAHGHKRVWHDVTNLDQIRIRMAWPDGREAEFLQSDIAAIRRPKFYVQGTAGTLVGTYRPVTFEHIEPGRGYVATEAHHAEAPADLMLARYETGYGISETRLPPAVEQPFAFHRNLADHLHLGEPLAVTPASVRRVIAVLEAAQRSSTEDGASGGDRARGRRLAVAAPAALGWGVIGATSQVAQKAVLPAICASPTARLVAVASERAVDLDTVCLGAARAYRSYAALLEDPDVEAVYVPLPNSLHREWVERAAAAGKHVLCEKPLAPTAADARAMARACEVAGVTLAEAYMTPFHPRARAVECLVASGRLGELRFARAVFTGILDRRDDHRWRPEMGGGALLDVGIYCLAPLVAAAGRPPARVEAAACRSAVGRRHVVLGLARLGRRLHRLHRVLVRRAGAPMARDRRRGGGRPRGPGSHPRARRRVVRAPRPRRALRNRRGRRRRPVPGHGRALPLGRARRRQPRETGVAIDRAPRPPRSTARRGQPRALPGR